MRSRQTTSTSLPRSSFAFLLALVGLLASLALAPLAGAAAKKGTIPSANLTKNPSFDRSAKGWDGFEAKVKRVRSKKAAHGESMAVVKALPGASSYTVDDVGETVTKRVKAGDKYTGSAWVKGSRASIGEPVDLVVREWGASGGVIDSSSASVKLSRKWQKVQVTHKVTADGSSIDIYAARPEGSVSGNDRFYIDVLTLEKRSDDGYTGPPHPVTPDGVTPVTTSQIALMSGYEDSLLTESGSEYRYVIVRDSFHGNLEALRARYPGAKILVYKDISFTAREPGCPYAPFQGGGLSYCVADPNESWFLHHESSGARLASDGYPDLRAMDISDPAYRAAWTASVLARLEDAHGNGTLKKWDGVFIDDANLYPGHGMDGQIAELSDAQYRTEAVEFLSEVGDQFEAAGFLTMANLGVDVTDPTQRASAIDVARHVSAINREGFVRWGEGALFTSPIADAGSWTHELTLMEEIQQAGAGYHAMTYGSAGDVQTQRYARATFLMGWDGTDGTTLAYRTNTNGNSWLPDWTTNVGEPRSARYSVGNGWRRDYTEGTVIVNPHPSSSVSYPLGGSFRKPDGSCVGSVTLSARTALVMPSC